MRLINTMHLWRLCRKSPGMGCHGKYFKGQREEEKIYI
jgi:hypothetical protein